MLPTPFIINFNRSVNLIIITKYYGLLYYNTMRVMYLFANVQKKQLLTSVYCILFTFC